MRARVLIDGLAALPQLRRLAPEARIVVLSGTRDAARARRAMASGADGYFVKGTALRHVVDAVAGRYRSKTSKGSTRPGIDPLGTSPTWRAPWWR